MRIVLAGATGFLGQPLIAGLKASGHQLTLLTRRPRGIGGLEEVEWHPDGGTAEWARVVDGADAVVNLAGEPLIGHRWTPARKETLIASRVLPTRSLVAAIDRS